MSKGQKSLIIIPARLASQRLPNKPLALIGSEAMIVHVARAGAGVEGAQVLVAAGDREIKEVVEKAGFEAILTDPVLPSGSDRCVAAIQQLQDRGVDVPEVVINLQGDMPNITPDSIRTVQQVLEESDCDCATLVHPCTPAQETDPNQVKAVLAQSAAGATYPRCLYFSRATIPAGEGTIWGHVGIYAWRLASLLEFARLPPSPLEKREKLEQLRALENNFVLRAAMIDEPPLSVDSPEDLEHAKRLMSQ